MNKDLTHLACAVELQPGEKLTLPPSLVENVGAGRWLITVQPVSPVVALIHRHDTFLNGYAAEDEGLYDDHPSR